MGCSAEVLGPILPAGDAGFPAAGLEVLWGLQEWGQRGRAAHALPPLAAPGEMGTAGCLLMDCQCWEQNLSPHLQNELLLLCEGDFRFFLLCWSRAPLSALSPGGG